MPVKKLGIKTERHYNFATLHRIYISCHKQFGTLFSHFFTTLMICQQVDKNRFELFLIIPLIYNLDNL